MEKVVGTNVSLAQLKMARQHTTAHNITYRSVTAKQSMCSSLAKEDREREFGTLCYDFKGEICIGYCNLYP